MNYITIGSLTVPDILVILFVTTFLTAMIYRIAYKRKTSDVYWNFLFLLFIVWKGSYILFHFPVFLKSPMSVLYFHGGTAGLVLALIISFVYVYMHIRKKQNANILEDLIPLYMIFVILFLVLQQVFAERYILAISLLLIGGIFFIYIRSKKPYAISFELLILFLLGMLFVFSILNNFFSAVSMIFLIIGGFLTAYLQLNKEDH